MPRLILALLSLTLAACVGPHLGASIGIGPNGTYVSPSISTGLEGGGTITYTP
jgi:hypothetical protein